MTPPHRLTKIIPARAGEPIAGGIRGRRRQISAEAVDLPRAVTRGVPPSAERHSATRFVAPDHDQRMEMPLPATTLDGEQTRRERFRRELKTADSVYETRPGVRERVPKR